MLPLFRGLFLEASLYLMESSAKTCILNPAELFDITVLDANKKTQEWSNN